MPTLQSIAIKQVKKGPMILVPYRDVYINDGLDGDCRGSGGILHKRQVTVLSAEQWSDTCTELGIELPWQTRRANLLVSGIKFGPEHLGKHLFIGSHVILGITGETAPCARMDESHEGLKKALTPNWRGGVTCHVVHEGTICVGESVFID